MTSVKNKIMCLFGQHKLHDSGISSEALVTWEYGHEQDMFVHYPQNDMFWGFYTTGKCEHCGKQLIPNPYKNEKFN